MYGQVADVYPVDEYFAFLDVIVTWDEVHKGRFSTAALSYERYGLALRNGEVYVPQHPVWLSVVVLAVIVGEGNVAELYLMLETVDMNRIFPLLYLRLSLQYLVDTLHGGKSLGDVVTGLGEVLEGVYDAVEYHQVINECRTGDDGIGAKDECSSEPQHDDYHHCAKKLTHRVGHSLPYVDAAEVVAVLRVYIVETGVHLFLSGEGLDDSQTSQRLLHLTHCVAPQRLCSHGLCFELTAYKSHEPAEKWYEENGEQCQLP